MSVGEKRRQEPARDEARGISDEGQTARRSAGLEVLESWWHSLKTIVYAVLLALAIRTFAYEPFNIPSGSMLPTLYVGDYLFVSKYSYGYSRYSLPLSLPLFEGRVLDRPLERGDVVVFKLPRDNETDYIKRVIGLPGDTVQMRSGTLYLNGEPVRRERADDFEYWDGRAMRRMARYRETLPGGASYLTLDTIENGRADDTRVFHVPPGRFFAMGDNRDNSLDSRAPVRISGVGYVPIENIVGRAEFLFFSTDGSARWWEVWKWPFAVRYGRLFAPIT